MARVVSPDRVLSAPVSLPSDFYRQEFIRHRECLARQREYFSESAITDADQALARVLSQLEQLCAQDDADQLIGRSAPFVQRRHRPFRLVRPEATALSGSFRRSDLQARRRGDLLDILRAAVDAVEPGPLVKAAVSAGTISTLPSASIFLVAAAKPRGRWRAPSSTRRFRPPEPLRREAGQPIAGVVAGPRGNGELPFGLEWFDAAHPYPNAASEAAGREALAGAARSRADGSLVVLLSGGASSLLAVPAEGLSIEDKIITARALMHAGAPIEDLNCVRKHLSAIKGGRLAAAAGRSLTLAISDVHGAVPDDPSVIGSGPTVADPTTFADALAVVREAGIVGQIPPEVIAHLERGADETPGPGDPRLAKSSSTG